ncbi:HYC_CC_PP family protein [Chondrinema litorale]|uniref:HYC_CC_PP family protein n=1 Tax=Chondrinema litorale TaxID=2994555 RepID=UPI002543B2A5|nr:hypothetical protein [Chondrinema litorale]UZR98916.1 hypothetical protein OQ292_34260 [Chondrinema litorale]
MKKAISILLSLLTLISNVGLSIDTHLCGGKAVKNSVSIGLHDLDCGMSGMDKDCELQYSSGKRLKSKTCCENQHQVLDMDDNVEIATAYQIINPIFLIAFVHTFVQPLFLKVAALIHNSYYSPPLRKRDIQVLFQTFLI